MGRGLGKTEESSEGHFVGVFGSRRGLHHKGTRTESTTRSGEEEYLARQFGPNWLSVNSFLDRLSSRGLAEVQKAQLEAFPQLKDAHVPDWLPFWDEAPYAIGRAADPLHLRVRDAAVRVERTQCLAAVAASVATRCLGFRGDDQAKLSFVQVAACYDAACALILQDVLSSPMLSILWEPYQLATGEETPWED